MTLTVPTLLPSSLPSYLTSRYPTTSPSLFSSYRPSISPSKHPSSDLNSYSFYAFIDGFMITKDDKTLLTGLADVYKNIMLSVSNEISIHQVTISVMLSDRRMLNVEGARRTNIALTCIGRSLTDTNTFDETLYELTSENIDLIEMKFKELIPSMSKLTLLASEQALPTTQPLPLSTSQRPSTTSSVESIQAVSAAVGAAAVSN